MECITNFHLKATEERGTRKISFFFIVANGIEQVKDTGTFI
jgi:hypothetical protein